MANKTTTHTDDWWEKYKAADEKAKGYASQIENRQPFKFDVNSDPMYEQLKDQYTQQGQLAMMDTVGNVSALTGGYGNSYAQTAGQQAFNQYMGQLNSAIPELYKSAYTKWQNEGNDLYNKYQLYAGARDSVKKDNEAAGWKNASSTSIEEIIEKVYKYGQKGENDLMESYLDGLVGEGRISQNYADELYIKYRSGGDDGIVGTVGTVVPPLMQKLPYKPGLGGKWDKDMKLR